MEPKYQNGSVALIRETGFDYDGAVYAVVWNFQTFIKKVYREKEFLLTRIIRTSIFLMMKTLVSWVKL